VDNLDETIKEIRQTIFALHEPLDGPSASTRGRVMQEIAQSAALLGFEPSVRFLGPVDTAVSPALGEHLIGVLREALTNSAKHAQSSRVDVLVAVEGDEVLLIVSDNGVGMPADGNVHRSGVANLMARALELGGTCTVDRISTEGGTRVTWHVPLDIQVPN
jgi:signal transduction histidine kinase